MEISEIRRENLRAIMNSRFGGRQTDLAAAVERAPNYISRCLSTTMAAHNRKNIGEELARDFERRLGLEPGQLDKPDAFTGVRAPASMYISNRRPARRAGSSDTLLQALLAAVDELDPLQIADLITYARQLSGTQIPPARTPMEPSHLDEPITANMPDEPEGHHGHEKAPPGGPERQAKN